MSDTDLITASDSTDVTSVSAATESRESRATQETKDTPATSDVKTTALAGSGSLSTMVLPELRALANQVGVKGTSGMRKSELIAAIQEIRNQSNGVSGTKAPSTEAADAGADAPKAEASTTTEAPSKDEQSGQSAGPRRRERRGASRDAGSSSGADGGADNKADDKANTDDKANQADKAEKAENRQDGGQDTKTAERKDSDQDQGGDQQGSGGQQARGGDDEGEGRQGRRGRRFRDRRRRGERSGEAGGEAELREDDVVQPVAGILDVLDNYAFVRTSGYLPGPHDVYVSMNMVRKYGLRRGDAVTGAVRVPKDGEQPNQRQKFNPLVRLDSVNGGPVEDAKKRPDFGKLTPLYPNQRLRLETTPERLTTRVIDLIMPIGKGQRALIVSPPKAGKTTILQDIANAITRNNPECHLMVVLVDERPEEVTDMTRSVKGEVIASTFDRPPSDHTSVAELAIERAKRLVEQGKDVVVLLDSITRLGRAYNNASPASGRILSGGVDSTALYPPKRFLGAARNIEEGGSLTIIATAMVETGSTGDTVIFEEFKGTGNAELKLDRKISERRVFPAVDVNPSGTRKDELLLSPDEFAIVHKLRRVLSGLDSHQAIDLLISQLRKTKTNYEFLVQVSKTTPGNMDND
ncbi:transcription termination factor Rho [Mycobacterium intermedium]|uniref:Transcription termination factor Rho n=1 Tax=Mycobacterium intermedium TaxID=28445 RepID=A0A1E3SGQ2_MYCIE|nr:transcription termination factor Rho [Mycobacterium intermedium]MCV6964530.1 transcription termination factor Rho [Mycobacterium intermedium]ODR01344.1 transcription termination factor Rho [Mycobacterium intermedium]OPE52557.1 transcription termination factor Rho [Mycobacterium intermedium]ORB07456.1 transcription termination factor Rho [Mycobacterium intermedium]